MNNVLSEKLSTNRTLMNWIPSLGSPRQEAITKDHITTEARAWDSYRKQSLARAAISRIPINSISDGLSVHPDINAEMLGCDPGEIEKLEDIAREEFTLYANTKDIDIRRMQNFSELQYQITTNVLVSGEFFCNTPNRKFGLYSTKVQFIEPERICNKDLGPDTKLKIRGVNMDADGCPYSYDVLRDYPGEILIGSEPYTWDTVNVFSPYGRRRFIHGLLQQEDRINLVRGESILVPIFEPLKNSDRLDEAELMGSLVSAFLAFFIENKSLDDELASPVDSFSDNDKQTSEYDFVNLGPAAMLELKDNKTIKPFTSSRPNAAYEAFSNAIAKKISACIGLPFEEILLNFNSSYSSSRAALLAAWRYYKVKRKFIIDNFCQPVYEAWFDEAVSRGILPVKNYGDERRRLLYTQAKWRGDQRGSIDPLQEINAASKAIESGISSVPTEIENRGGDWEETVKLQKKYEKRKSEEKGIGDARISLDDQA